MFILFYHSAPFPWGAHTAGRTERDSTYKRRDPLFFWLVVVAVLADTSTAARHKQTVVVEHLVEVRDAQLLI